MESQFNQLPLNARIILTTTHLAATEEDAVRVCIIDGDKVRTDSACWPLPAWPGVEKEYNVRDLALACALAGMDAEWPDTDRMCTTEYYTDNHGSWCTGCGNSVHDASDEAWPPLVCANDHCEKFAPHRLPAWVKEYKSIA